MATLNGEHTEQQLRIGRGLVNLGNSCFLNATLQALFHIPAILRCLQNKLQASTQKCECAICCTLALFEDTKCSIEGPSSPLKLYRRLQKTNYRFLTLLNGKQQDAHEFLKLFAVEMENKKHPDFTFGNLFATDILSEVECLKCNTISQKSETSKELILNIQGKESIENALESYFEDELLDEYMCEACKIKDSARKRNILLNAPKCLCIILNRFTQSRRKNKDDIKISLELNLSTNIFKGRNCNWKYQLKAIVNHVGSTPRSGHYTTIGYHENMYHKFDDGNVFEVDEKEITGNNPYMLFFELEEELCTDINDSDGIDNDNLDGKNDSDVISSEDEKEWTLIDVIYGETDEGQTQNLTEDESNKYMENEVINDTNDRHSSNQELFTNHEKIIKIELLGEDESMHVNDLLEDQSNIYMENEVNHSDFDSDTNLQNERMNIEFSSGSDTNEIQFGPELSDENEDKLYGSRIIDIELFMKQLQGVGTITCKKCCIGEMVFTKERKKGLISIFQYNCTHCDNKQRIDSCSTKDKTQANTNEAAILGIVSIGLGYYHLEELLTNFKIPCMSYQSFYSIEKKLQSDWWNLAKKLEDEALLKEIELAKECNSIDSAGNALMTIKADGSWQKRSYGKNYSSLAGCAAIIGIRTNKIIYCDVKNKYCHICKIAQSKNSPVRKHECNANYCGPSTGMENVIIVEGFKDCEKKGARFDKFIGDGDSSTYKTIRDLRLYKNPEVYTEKFDCVNHVNKNFIKSFADLEGKTKFKKTSRKLISRKIGEDICMGVRMAAKHWNEVDIPIEEKCRYLERDAMNAPLHCFGVHDNCDKYFCTKITTPQARNTVDILKSDGLFYEILKLCQTYFANKAKSLIAGYENNVAEGYMSLIAKVLGGKRVNNALAGSYKSRTAIASIHLNTGGHSGSTFQEFKFGKIQPEMLKMENARKRKVVSTAIRKQTNTRKRRSIDYQGPNKKKKKTAYGDGHEDVDFSPSQLQLAKNLLLEELDRNKENRIDIEIQTRGQRYSRKWEEVRRNLVTSTYFGRILHVRSRKSYSKIVEDILYHNIQYSNTAEINHQRLYENKALELFCQHHKDEPLHACGIFIDEKYSFLGASPFRLYGQDGLVVVKCPLKEFNISINDAIEKKLIPFWIKELNGISINHKSHWYIEIQGQLHISGKKFAYLVVYLGESQYKFQKVDRSDDFWMKEMEEELVFFFNEALVKEIVDSRDARYMEVREYDESTKTFI